MWIKSTYSDSNACVEVAPGSRYVMVRDSQADPRGVVPVLLWDRATWVGFLADVKAGRCER